MLISVAIQRAGKQSLPFDEGEKRTQESVGLQFTVYNVPPFQGKTPVATATVKQSGE